MDLSRLGDIQFNQKTYDQQVVKIKEEIGDFNSKNLSEVEDKIDKANNLIATEKTHLKFEIHEETHTIMIKIIESDTGDVLKEIPPEKLVDMIAEICKSAGLFIDKKV